MVNLSSNFNADDRFPPFENSGVYINGIGHMAKTNPHFDGEKIVLADVLQNGGVAEDFFVPPEDYPKWEYLKGAKKETRTAKSGFQYAYSEGNMIFPDALDNASRTIITGEGGKSASRFEHIVQTSRGLRRLTPIELERLNMFPDNHTQLEGISDIKRAFFMGNALVVGVVEQIGNALAKKTAALTEPRK